jgi:hypothetical protein
MRHLTYSCSDHQEQLLVFGPEDANRRILIVPPFFDEMNRVRHTLVEAMRTLAKDGVASALPDFPGCNESPAKLEDQSLDTWHQALRSAAHTFSATHFFAIRGGCLIDGSSALPTMHLAPVKGASLLKILVRTRVAGDKEAALSTTAESLTEAARSGPVELAGNMVGRQLWADLESAMPAGTHNIFEVKMDAIGGTPLWLRAEPQHDARMAKGLAATLAQWSAAR